MFHNEATQKAKIEQCCHKLKTVLYGSPGVEFGRLSVVLSCMLHSFRPLHDTEMATILTLLLLGTTHESLSAFSQHTIPLMDLLPDGSDLLISATADGYLYFVDPLFSTFLKGVPIAGIDRTPSTLARACLSQLEMHRGLPSTRSRQKTNPSHY